MPTDNHCSTSSQESRDPDEIDQATKPGFLPGVNGDIVYAAIEQLAASKDECSVVIEKRRTVRGKFAITVDIKKL
ncbi:hypothetical protein [Herbaspirillum sp. RV1423]|uniref:hypothetical protein n=1 Tax=Herbaspirillum sp. RV1423 TaxID=1443993 RepID=UPI0004BC7445|nr:hypothetical protein [Herbaspirillum sp. RV1423]